MSFRELMEYGKQNPLEAVAGIGCGLVLLAIVIGFILTACVYLFGIPESSLLAETSVGTALLQLGIWTIAGSLFAMIIAGVIKRFRERSKQKSTYIK
jgi:hypothetical protein